MTRCEVYERLTKIFRKVFDDDELVIEDTTSAKDIEDWDSFEQINLLCAVEEEFSFEIPVKTVTTLKNVGEMVDVILESGK